MTKSCYIFLFYWWASGRSFVSQIFSKKQIHWRTRFSNADDSAPTTQYRIAEKNRILKSASKLSWVSALERALSWNTKDKIRKFQKSTRNASRRVILLTPCDAKGGIAGKFPQKRADVPKRKNRLVTRFALKNPQYVKTEIAKPMKVYANLFANNGKNF